MKITIYDTISELEPFYVGDSHPKVRFERAKRTILAPDGLVPALQSLEKLGYTMMEATQHDGYSVAVGQQVWGLFNPTRKREASIWVFEQLLELKVLKATETWLHQLVTYFDERMLPEEIICYLLPGDPANCSFMINSHGLSCIGGRANQILVQIWPSANNLARLDPALARMLVHNLRWMHLPSDQPPTLGDYLVMEGLAANFIETAFPDLSAPPWLVPVHEPENWSDTLNEIASQFYNIDDYSDVWANIYGSTRRIGPERPPVAQPLDDEDLEYAHEIIREVSSISDPYLIAAHLYGDEIVAAQGHPTVGLPPYAGFEVGYRLVHEYLIRTGCGLNEAIPMSTQEILNEQLIERM